MATKKSQMIYVSVPLVLLEFIDKIDMKKLGVTKRAEYFRTLVRLRKENE